MGFTRKINVIKNYCLSRTKNKLVVKFVFQIYRLPIFINQCVVGCKEVKYFFTWVVFSLKYIKGRVFLYFKKPSKIMLLFLYTLLYLLFFIFLQHIIFMYYCNINVLDLRIVGVQLMFEFLYPQLQRISFMLQFVNLVFLYWVTLITFCTTKVSYKN